MPSRPASLQAEADVPVATPPDLGLFAEERRFLEGGQPSPGARARGRGPQRAQLGSGGGASAVLGRSAGGPTR